MNNKSEVAWIKTQDSLVVCFKGETHNLLKTDNGYEKVLKAISEGRLDDIPELVSLAKRVEKSSNGLFKVVNGRVTVDGEEVPDLLGSRIIEHERDGLPFEPLVKFAKNLNKNPSYRSVQQLFQFLEVNRHPITDDGCFIAYKKVRSDFKDCYTGTIDNSVGKVVEMPRNKVNEDPNQTCSHGLHVANWNYAKDFQSGIMIQVKVNPADVVAVPIDYNSAKMRVCRYEVMSVVENPTDSLYVDTSCSSDCGSCSSEECYEEEDEDPYYEENYYDDDEEEEEDENW